MVVDEDDVEAQLLGPAGLGGDRRRVVDTQLQPEAHAASVRSRRRWCRSWAKSHMKLASGLAWRWQPPDSRVPSSASVWYGEPSSTWRGMPWKPMVPMSVCSQRIICGRIGLAVPRRRHLGPAVHLVRARQLVAVLAARHQPRADDVAVLVDGPDALAGPVVDDASACAGVRGQRRGVGRRPDGTDDSGKPSESTAPAGGGGVWTTSDSSSGQMPSEMPVSRPTTPSTNRSAIGLQLAYRCEPSRCRTWPLICPL